MEFITWPLTQDHLQEGGRLRHELEVYLKLDAKKRAFLGSRDITLQTDDDWSFPVRLSGNPGRRWPDRWINLRAGKHIGAWLQRRGGALIGDQVRVSKLPDGAFLVKFLPNSASRANRLSLDQTA